MLGSDRPQLLRIVVGLLFVAHGIQILFHFPPPDHRMGMRGLTPPMTVDARLELVGGLLLVFGLLTRLVAFVIVGEMAGAYLMAHAPVIPGGRRLVRRMV